MTNQIPRASVVSPPASTGSSVRQAEQELQTVVPYHLSDLRGAGDGFDAMARLEHLETETARLRDWLREVMMKSAAFQHGDLQAVKQALSDRAGGGVAVTPLLPGWRTCEFCDCKTNADERICCSPGRDADRKRWDRRARDT